jgi:hypothetical protein
MASLPRAWGSASPRALMVFWRGVSKAAAPLPCALAGAPEGVGSGWPWTGLRGGFWAPSRARVHQICLATPSPGCTRPLGLRCEVTPAQATNITCKHDEQRKDGCSLNQLHLVSGAADQYDTTERARLNGGLPARVEIELSGPACQDRPQSCDIPSFIKCV